MIETLSLRNFRILREVDVELRPFTLLVGPNASGKSTVLDALALFSGALSTQDPAASSALFQEPASFLSKKAHGSLAMRASGRYGGEAFQAELTTEHTQSFIDWKWRDETFRVRLQDNIEGWRSPMRRPLQLTLEPRLMAEPSYPEDIDLVLPPNGAGLSSILAGLQLEFPDKFRALVEQLSGIVPEVLGIRIKRIPLNTEKGMKVGFELRFDMRGGDDIPASTMSDGTLLTLGLLTILTSHQEAPELVLTDELEHGLHPKGLGDLIRQLRRFQEQNPELQIIATSHSPYLLDHFKAEEILLTSLDEEGYAVIKPLTDHPEYERWKDLMAPGEFWSTVGESWITQQDPKKVPATGR